MVLDASRDVSPVSLPRAYQSRVEVKCLARIRACGFESHSPNYGGVFRHKVGLGFSKATTFTLIP